MSKDEGGGAAAKEGVGNTSADYYFDSYAHFGIHEVRNVKNTSFPFDEVQCAMNQLKFLNTCWLFCHISKPRFLRSCSRAAGW